MNQLDIVWKTANEREVAFDASQEEGMSASPTSSRRATDREKSLLFPTARSLGLRHSAHGAGCSMHTKKKGQPGYVASAAFLKRNTFVQRVVFDAGWGPFSCSGHPSSVTHACLLSTNAEQAEVRSVKMALDTIISIPAICNATSL